MGGTRFMVQWEEHPSHLATRLGQLLEHQTLVDVTLMCNTHTLRVHRAVLAACSPYFETILQRQLGMHPLIVLKDMQFSVLKSLIEFMYCGETSVTEDNLGALLQAAKFFQVKGLSAMTKEALGLVPNTKSTVNGDAARKAFVGRPKRVGMQQTFMTTTGMKALPSTHAAGSHIVGEVAQTVVPTKPGFQTVSKPVMVGARPDTQQQAESAQLLLSLSGSEFPKQTFHTVSKNVRFHHNLSAVTVEPSRTCSVDSSVVKKETVERVPALASNGGTKPATVVAGELGLPIAEDTMVATAAPPVYMADPPRKRGRPIKRQMNVVFQDKVLTDADMALHKEAEASRKALEMLRQEMLTEPAESTGAAATAPVPAPVATSSSNIVAQVSSSPAEFLRKVPVNKQVIASTSKVQNPLASIQTPTVTTTSRTLTQPQHIANNIAPKKVSVNTNIVYKTIGNAAIDHKRRAIELITPEVTVAATEDSSSNDTNVVCKEENSELPTDQAEEMSPEQTEMTAEQVYQLATENSATEDAPKEENVVEYQVTEDNNGEQEVDLGNGNTNIVYQMADTTGATAGSVMSQYMEVLKEAGLPTDVPILLDSGDGSYVTVNEEVLMNIVNGGVLQCHVTEGNFVAGDGVEFIVQELSESEVDAAQQAAEATNELQTEGSNVESGDTNVITAEEQHVATDVVVNNDEISQDMQEEECGNPVSQEEIESNVLKNVEQQQQSPKYEGLPSLEEDEKDIDPVENAVVERTDPAIKMTEEEADIEEETKPIEEEEQQQQQQQVEAYYTPDVEETMDVATGEGSIDIVREEESMDAAGEESMDPTGEEESMDVAGDEESMDIAEGENGTADSGVEEPELDVAGREDEIITGDRYGEAAMEGFPVMKRGESLGEAVVEDFPAMKREQRLGEAAMEGFPVMKRGESLGEAVVEDFPVMEREQCLGEADVEHSQVMKREESLADAPESSDETPESLGEAPESEETITYTTTAQCNVDSGFIFQEESTSSEGDQKEVEEEDENQEKDQGEEEKVEIVVDKENMVEVAEEEKEVEVVVDEEEKEEEEKGAEVVEEENKIEVLEERENAEESVVEFEEPTIARVESSKMSVEEALQEMMGESSDTEIDICDGTNPPSATMSQDEGDSQTTTTEQRSPEQEAEELRLVLSHEEEQLSVVKARASKAGSASVRSFSLGLSTVHKAPPDTYSDSGNSESVPDIACEDTQSSSGKPEMAEIAVESSTEAVHDDTSALTLTELAVDDTAQADTSSEEIASDIALQAVVRSELILDNAPQEAMLSEEFTSDVTEEPVATSQEITSKEVAQCEELALVITSQKEESAKTVSPTEEICTSIATNVAAPSEELASDITLRAVMPCEDLSEAVVPTEDLTSDITPQAVTTSEEVPVDNAPKVVILSDKLESDVTSQTDLPPEEIYVEKVESKPDVGPSQYETPALDEVSVTQSAPYEGEMYNSENECGPSEDEVSSNVQGVLTPPSGASSNELDESMEDEEDTVISPNKDIPFAVGLLPLKTALEKLQAMPEYHPRKTRSSSTGKESAPDVPPARVKRKASSTDGPDKKQKICEGEDIVGQHSLDDDMDTSDAQQTDDITTAPAATTTTTSAKCHKRWPIYEHHGIDDMKEGDQPLLHSMPELLSESTEG